VRQYGPYDAAAGSGVYTVARAVSRDGDVLAAAAAQTLAILRSGADVVYQGAFLREGFNGFADFIVRNADGEYAVYDSKLARHAKVSALLQLAAYGDELRAGGIAVAPQVHLILGDLTVVSHDLGDLIPVYRERRARLEAMVAQHLGDSEAVQWNDPRFAACGRCDECNAEVEAARDVLLVAGMRITQRARLRDGGVVTIDDLAVRTEPVDGLRDRTLSGLRAQAAMQLRQVRADGAVQADIIDPSALAVIPRPDAGDIFFDFEGDPLWSDGDPSITGLEYLFGVVEVDSGVPVFRPFWAHDRAQEKQALQDFLAYVQARRTQFPNLHIYHYAAYEKSALLRLAGRFGVGEAIVDTLLAEGVLVDLYSVVRTSVLISQRSYSLKKLEPLYMGDDLRRSDVQNAGDSIVAYELFCDWRDAGDGASAQTQLRNIAEYNEYDCVSTYRLREWLIGHAEAHGVELVGPRTDPPETAAEDDDADLVARLLVHVGDGPRSGRTREQQAIAMLAASIGYHRRELKPFWWAHFDRLINPVSQWADAGDVFIVDSARVISDWSRVGKQRSDRRTVRLTGSLGVGARLEVGDKPFALYDSAGIPAGFDAAPGQRGVCTSITVQARSVDAQGRDEIEILELCKTGIANYRQLPMALVPGDPIRSANQHAAIVELATSVADALDAGIPADAALDAHPALQLLARRAPRQTDGGGLPIVVDADYVTALTDAVRELDGSYLAVQGPPGSGKTYVGAHVIAALVAQGWRIGVIAQSHKVVENVLSAVAEAGVEPGDIAKKPAGPSRGGMAWTELGSDPSFGAFIADHTEHIGGSRGFVIGGTAWDFANRKRIGARSLDLLVVDEAGQFSLANTIAVSTAATRLLLLGDPQQLPQVSQGTHPEPCDDSALGWVIEGHRVMPPDRGYFLALTWRMHPDLAAAVSRLAYDDQLHANVEVTAHRRLKGIDPGPHVIEIDHVGNSVESTEEADAVVETVADMIGRRWSDQFDEPRALTGADILVVAPYNAQVAMIRQRLDIAGYAEVQTGSVDRFQGQEAPVVIVSMTASAPEDVPRGMDFLLSRNRVNVAISRGMWCAMVIRSSRLTDYLPTNPHGLGRLGAFIGLCSSAASHQKWERI
jgi:predicted RecB family nuclease